MKTRVVLALAILMTVFTLSAYAQAADQKGQQKPKMADDLKKADTSGDQKVSFDELKAVRPGMTQEKFTKLDRNKDGFLTKEDFREFAVAAKQGFKEADANGDKQVTFDELKAKRPGMTKENFAKLDRNGDGVLTAADKPEQGAKPAKEAAPQDLFKQADTNKDGKVSPDEFKVARPKAPADRFAKIDKNKDGMITPDELPKPAGKLQEADTNKDGKVTFEEFQKARPGGTQDQYNALDTNKDGILTQEDRPAKEPKQEKKDKAK